MHELPRGLGRYPRLLRQYSTRSAGAQENGEIDHAKSAAGVITDGSGYGA
jgi:hypothetical protein